MATGSGTNQGTGYQGMMSGGGPNLNLGQNVNWGHGAGPRGSGDASDVMPYSKGGYQGNIGGNAWQGWGGQGQGMGQSWWDRYTPEQKQQYLQWRQNQTRGLPERIGFHPPPGGIDAFQPPTGGFHPPPGGTDAFQPPNASIMPIYANYNQPTPQGYGNDGGQFSSPLSGDTRRNPGNNYPPVNQASQSPYSLPRGFGK